VDPVEETYQVIDSTPKVKCGKCGNDKVPCLFTPGQLKRTNPKCRMCCKRTTGGGD
jgi:hypothetical protein